MSNGIVEKNQKYFMEATFSPIHTGYKQTEVGFIPEDWDCSSFDYVCSIIGDGIHSTPKYNDSGEYFFINGNNLINGKITTFDETKKTDSSEFCKHKKPLNERTILLSINGTIGNIAFYKDEQIVLGKSAAYLNIKSTINKYYIYYCLGSKKTLQAFYDGLTGSTIKNLGLGTIRRTNIPLPPQKEQTAIANALSDVDVLIYELEKLIAKKQAIKTATMQQLLTGRTRLPQFALREDGSKKGTKQSELGEISEDWKIISIAQETTLKARIGWQALTTKEYQTTGDIYLVTGTDFDSGVVKWERCFYVSEWRYKQDQNIQLRNDDVLITKDGTIGKVGFVATLNRPATLNSGVFVIRPKYNNLIPRFLFYVLTSRIFDDFISRITAGSTITHLYQKDFVNFEFSAPDTDEQTAIATLLSDMDEEIQALEQRLSKTRQIKQGMMQELLTGRTRLV